METNSLPAFSVMNNNFAVNIVVPYLCQIFKYIFSLTVRKEVAGSNDTCIHNPYHQITLQKAYIHPSVEYVSACYHTTDFYQSLKFLPVWQIKKIYPIVTSFLFVQTSSI